MNLSYSNGSNWSQSSSGSQYSALMQPIPTMPAMQSNVQHTNVSPVVLFTPYNLSPISAAPIYNGFNSQFLDGSYKSAFKPVVRRRSHIDAMTEKKFKLCATASSYYNSSNDAPTMKCYGQTTMQAPVPNCYDSHINGKLIGYSTFDERKEATVHPTHKNIDERCELAIQHHPSKMNEFQRIQHIPNTQYGHMTHDNHDGKIYQWECSMPIIPETMKPKMLISPKKFHIQKYIREISPTHQQLDLNQTNVPIIDLTLNEDVDQPPSSIQSNATPSLDINGNEILITDTKTMQTYENEKYMNGNALNQPEGVSPESSGSANSNASSISSDVISSTMTLDQTNSQTLHINHTKNNHRLPLKEQFKNDEKCKRTMQYIRSYNSFRVFVQRNYIKAQAHSTSKENRTIVQNTLIRWWNALSPMQKEQYAQIADMRKYRIMASGKKSPHMQQNVNVINVTNTE